MSENLFTMTKPIRHRVHIIESPHSRDLLQDRREGAALFQALRLGEVNATYSLAATPETFKEAIRSLADIVESSDEFHLPFIHISAHGSDAGIHLTDGSTLDWNDLRDELEDLSEALGMAKANGLPVSRLSLAMSTCDGYSAVGMHDDISCPYAFLIGPIGAVTWPDSLTAFQVFYRGLLTGESTIPKLVKRMNAAIDLDIFQYHVAPNIAKD
jgi:hypothetical protein